MGLKYISKKIKVYLIHLLIMRTQEKIKLFTFKKKEKMKKLQ